VDAKWNSDLAELAQTVPEDLAMPDLDEALRLAAKYTANANGRCQVFGRTRTGEELLAFHVGSGPVHTAVIACQHSNEPIGLPTAVELLRILGQAADAGDPRLRAHTFTVVPVWDADAARRSPGVFAPYPTLTDAHLRFHRAHARDQPEWTFPVHPGERAALPETRAMMRLLNHTRPDSVVGLHNNDFGTGAYFVTDHPHDGLVDQLSAIPARHGLPLDDSSTDCTGWSRAAPAVWAMPASYQEEGGISTMQYAARTHGSIGVIPEVPMWISTPPPTPNPATWPQRLREMADTAEAADGPLSDTINRTAGDFPLCPVAAGALQGLQATHRQATQCRDLARPRDTELATIMWTSTWLTQLRLPLRTTGLVIGLTSPHECQHPIPEAALLHAVGQLAQLTAALGQVRPPQLQPLWRPVRAQLATVLTTAAYAVRRKSAIIDHLER